jgi:hypothetical protein
MRVNANRSIISPCPSRQFKNNWKIMSISHYSATVPVFKQMLTALSEVLKKGEAYAQQRKFDPVTLLQSRLFPDMLPLVRQVQIACDFAQSVPMRIAGLEVAAYEDTEQSFAELQSRISKTLALINALTPAQLDGSSVQEIVLRPGTPKEKKLSVEDYALKYGMPQFFFHVTTAYNILRLNGVEIGKKDFMGSY